MAAPDISDIGDVTYAENTVNATPQAFASTATVADADDDVSVVQVSGLLPEDSVVLAGDGFLYISGTDVYWDPAGLGGGAIVGTLVSTGLAGSDFYVSFSGPVTAAVAQYLLGRLVYSNSSNTPTQNRTLVLTVQDLLANGDSDNVQITVTPQIDLITGTAAGETINGTALRDDISAQDGDDTVNGGAGNDHIDGDKGDDTLNGDAGDDKLTGGLGADILNGGADNDRLDGGAGNDTMAGGTGDDSYNVDSAGDIVTELANQGTDTVVSSINYALGKTLENLTIIGTVGRVGAGNNYANVIRGGSGDDTLSGKGGDDDIYGGDGNDTIKGDGNDDWLFGDKGDDTLNGGIGDDDLWGGQGADILIGGDGIDYLYGGDGNDTYHLTYGDLIFENAGEGYDTVIAYESYILDPNVEALTFAGLDPLAGVGNELDNTITGNRALNLLYGDLGDDTLIGKAGDDALFGEDGKDTLRGDDGWDWIEGGAGRDKLYGGKDGDIFVFTEDDLTGGEPDIDQIFDLRFSDGDVIDLSEIDAIAGGADDAFTFVAKFTGTAGEATLKLVGKITVLSLDVNGDGKADFIIQINGDVTGTTGNLWTCACDTDGGWYL